MNELGIFNGYRVTQENENNLLPRRCDVQEKLLFNFEDVVCFSVPMNENAHIRGLTRFPSSFCQTIFLFKNGYITGFATDRDYHERNGVCEPNEEFKEWVDDDAEEVDLDSVRIPFCSW